MSQQKQMENRNRKRTANKVHQKWPNNRSNENWSKMRKTKIHQKKNQKVNILPFVVSALMISLTESILGEQSKVDGNTSPKVATTSSPAEKSTKTASPPTPTGTRTTRSSRT